ncbi:hypothetical protein A2121_01330 [Candidatus Nomurabacteria bacterium GWB1_40_6]|uniref:Peptidoglycan binding-like domain-containing protein n=1 Tax=Candidatus Nomurabacteria bacterium GWB1_40_6 TaxID=1801727 RepID=A0A1F6TLZ0_9BACT|nr:MAG: hypothetical protein A2121_01330 [Candidatus Nomurabacteria bacterium GWB1_40_6]
MSNLLKSKFLLGVMFVAVLVVAGGAFATPAAADCTITTTLRVGSVGTEVSCLQTIIGATADGKFGPMTKAAVMAWQAGKGLVADGVFGPMSRAAMGGGAVVLPAGCQVGWLFNPATGASCTPGTTPTTPSGDLEGGAGSVTVDDLPTYSSEEVGEDEEDVKVLAFEVEAEGSDVEISSVKVELVESGATSSEDLDDYAQSVSVWFDGEKVGEADVDDFSESSTEVWTRSISLDSGVVIKEDDTEKLEIAVTANSTIDSSDSDSDLWTVDVLNVRFEDGEGVVTTEDTDGDALEQTFDFAEFAAAADLELKVSLDDDNINDAHVINIHATAETDNVDLLSFELEAEGNSDITVNDLSVNFDTVGVNLEDAVTTVTLWANGEQIGTENITKNTATPGTDETIEFDRLSFKIDAGDTAEFIVKADLESIADGIVDGDTISAQVSATERALIEAEDESGNDVGTTDLTGAASGDAHAMYDAGMNAAYVSSTAVATPSGVATVDDTGTFKINFDVTAFDSDVYVDASPITDETGIIAAGAAGYQNIDASTTSVGAGVIECASCDTAANTTLKVPEGTTKRFTVTVAGSGADVFASASLTSIMYALTAVDGDTLYTFGMSDFKTDSVWLDSN